MTINMDQTVEWKQATGDVATMLDELQPNIVKGHVRDALSVRFLHFDDQAEGRTFIAALTTLMKSAKQHLNEVAAHKADPTLSGTPYVGFGLSHSGYAALGIDQMLVPTDQAFANGMKSPASRSSLSDPPISTWDSAYQQDIHAVLLVGDSNDAAMVTRLVFVESLMPASVRVLGEETGASIRNNNGDGLEHFGYVDGRSQPLFLTEDVQDETNTTAGTTVWDPAFGVGRVIVSDPAAPDPSVHHGSYFIFRKLEQNVRRFKQAENDLADRLGLTGQDAERAGALLVGRFEDGTPLAVQKEAGAHHDVLNDFDYDSDVNGIKCPHGAHIRKTNPRGSGGFEPAADERHHIMARRGQTYGDRLDDINAKVGPEGRPTGGVGLLFMAFNTSIKTQFEFTQQVWANNPGFPKKTGPIKPGVDAVMGQGARPQVECPIAWGSDIQSTTDPIAQAVRMRGGEYFFMPSLAFLRSL